MKKLLFSILIISFLGCQNQREVLPEADSVQALRMLDFQKYETAAGMHSDYLAYVFEHMSNETKKSAIPKTPDELYRSLNVITASFAADKLQLDNSYTSENFTQQVVASNAIFLTRSENSTQTDLPLIVTEFFSKIDKLPEGLDAGQFKKAVEDIVREESLLANSSDDEFRTLAITAAICIDSYDYWSENYPAWKADLFENTTTRGFWSSVWQEVKRLSKEDAGYGAVAIPGAMYTGPMALNVIAASAGVGSVYEAFKPYM